MDKAASAIVWGAGGLTASEAAARRQPGAAAAPGESFAGSGSDAGIEAAA